MYFVSFARESEPTIRRSPEHCKRVIGQVCKVRKGRFIIGGRSIPTYSPGRGLFQVAVKNNCSYLSIRERIVTAPKRTIFLHALLPLLLPKIFPIPDSLNFRIARVAYPSMFEYLPYQLVNQLNLYSYRDPKRFLPKHEDEEVCGGRIVFLPVILNKRMVVEQFSKTKTDPHLVLASARLPKLSAWYDKITTISDIRQFETDCPGLSILLRLTAPTHRQKIPKLSDADIDELLRFLVEKRDLWFPDIVEIGYERLVEMFQKVSV